MDIDELQRRSERATNRLLLAWEENNRNCGAIPVVRFVELHAEIVEAAQAVVDAETEIVELAMQRVRRSG